MSHEASKFNKQRFNKHIPRKVKSLEAKEQSEKVQQCRERIEQWIRSVPYMDSQPNMAEGIYVQHDSGNPKPINSAWDDYLDQFPSLSESASKKLSKYKYTGRVKQTTPKQINSDIQSSNVLPQRLHSHNKRSSISVSNCAEDSKEEIVFKQSAVKNLNKQFEQTELTRQSQQSTVTSASKCMSDSVNATLSTDQSLFNNAFTQSGVSYALSVELAKGSLTFLKEKSRSMDEMNPKNVTTKDIDPEKVTSKQIFELLKSLEQRINDIDTKLPSTQVKTTAADGTAIDTSMLSSKVQTHAAKIKQVSDQIQICKLDHERMQIMADTIIRQDQVIHDLNNQVMQMQVRSMKSNIIINGIAEREKEDCLQIAKDFIKEKLKLSDDDAKPTKAFRIGIGQNRPILMEMADPTVKSKIFKSATNLKGAKNAQEKPYSLNDHLPEPLAEEKRQANMFIKHNRSKPSTERITLAMKKGTLQEENVPYKPQIITLQPLDLLELSPVQLKQINAMPVHQGERDC